ncbi:MAG: DUF4286 family protein [Saprospiraceae bacterium]|mgnify:CR=1 FL=1|nr:DUF4286 family protein [Saprospiraceae bacterium]
MKVLYNVTVKIDHSVHDEWLSWMTAVHIPDVMATGCFESYTMNRIIGDNDEHGQGYAIQYTARNMQEFQRYNTDYAPSLQKAHAERYRDMYVAFRTLMEIVEQG